MEAQLIFSERAFTSDTLNKKKHFALNLFQADTLKERYQKIGDTKRNTPIEVLCENFPGMLLMAVISLLDQLVSLDSVNTGCDVT